jgi:hypothetical protein
VQSNDNQPVLPFKGHYLARQNEGIQFSAINIADIMWIKHLYFLHHQWLSPLNTDSSTFAESTTMLMFC